MFSVPESMAIRARRDGKPPIGASSLRERDRRAHPRTGPARRRGPVGSPNSTTGHALRAAPGRRRDRPRTMLAVLRPRARSTGCHTVRVQVVLGERAVGAARVGVARQHRHQLERVHGAAAARPDHLLRVGVQLAHRLGRRLGDPHREPGAGRPRHPQQVLRGLVRRRRGVPELDEHLLQPQRLPGQDATTRPTRRGRRDRPQVQQHAVPVQPRVVAVGRAGGAQRPCRRRAPVPAAGAPGCGPPRRAGS